MKLDEFFQRLCRVPHPLDRGLRLAEHLLNGGGADATGTLSAVLNGWKSVPYRDEHAHTTVERREIARAFPQVLGHLDRILITTTHGTNERNAAIIAVLNQLPTELERGILLGLLLARRSGPLAECLYVTTGSNEKPEALEAQDLRSLMLR
jgi:hypothetical protein